jgi:hypothetical protein
MLVAGLGNKAFEHFALLIDCTPQVDHLAVQLHVHSIEVPTPIARPARAAHPLTPNFTCEHQPDPVSPKPHRLMAYMYPKLEQQVFDVPQTEREANVHYHDQPDNVGRVIEVTKWAGWLLAWTRHPPALLAPSYQQAHLL